MNITYQTCNLKKAKEIYETYLCSHFPPVEVKPFSHIERMSEEGKYQVLIFKNCEALIGYAFVVLVNDTILLDYFAILPEFRCEGFGGRCLEMMKAIYQEYDGIVIETENLMSAQNEEEVLERNRRNDFYRAHGVIETSITEQIYEANFQVWYYPMGKMCDEDAIYEKCHNIYQVMLPGEKFKHVHIHRL